MFALSQVFFFDSHSLKHSTALAVQTYGAKLTSKNMATPAKVEAASTCNNVDYHCGEQITICGSGGPYGNCFCAGDVSGHTQCVQDTSCASLTHCSEGGECGGGQVCLSGANCCGVPNCVPLCNGSSSTTTSMPTTTTTTSSPNMCTGINWQCGGSVTICGSQGPYDECFCGDDVNQDQQCFIDEACSGEPQCSQNSGCPSGSLCVTGTCCEVSLCLPICTGNSQDPVERLLENSVFHTPTEQDRACAEEFVDCREKCMTFGRCTAKHGECTPKAVECLRECESKKKTCDNANM